MRKHLLCRASPGDPMVGNQSSSHFPPPGDGEMSLSLPPHFTLCCSPPEGGPSPTSREEGVRVLDEGFHHAHHLDGGDRGQVQLHRISERQGWERHQKRVLGDMNPFGAHS